MNKPKMILAMALVGAAVANAQTATVLATGLNSPQKVALTPEGNLLVSEATVQTNTGRISIVSRPGGVRRTLLDGLPSGPAAPNNQPLGPCALVLDGRTLYIGILEGNTLVPGATPGSLAFPNPAGPSSPIYSSILRVRLGADVDRITSSFSLTLDNHFTLADGDEVQLTNSDRQTATADLLADFPDTPLDVREIYGHVTPYGMALDPARAFLYVADAGQNRIIKVNVTTGRWQTLVRLPRVPRVPPIPTQTETDAVPTSVRFYGDEMLVTYLTGAPFAEGEAVVRIVNPVTRGIRQFINGLTTATDVLVRERPGRSQFFALEARTQLGRGPGRLIQYDTAEARVIADQLAGPTGMAQDPATGDIFVVEYSAGRITQVKLQ
jgi:hypothetical protein